MYLLRPEQEELQIFDAGKELRRKQYSEFLAESTARCLGRNRAELERLTADGFALLRGCADADILRRTALEMDRLIESGSRIKPPKNVRETPADAHWTLAGHVRPELLTGGSDQLRGLTNTVDIQDPFLTFPELLGVALNETVVDTAAAYLDCYPAVTFIKLRRSFVNALPEFDTNFFHVDGNSHRLIKTFVYLADVTEADGPFCYVRGSHRTRFEGWKSKDRFTAAEMASHYGTDAIVPVTARAGDVIIADTSGFHCGLKPVRQDRSIAIINYVIHEEYGGGGDRVRVHRRQLQTLNARQAAACDQMEICES